MQFGLYHAGSLQYSGENAATNLSIRASSIHPSIHPSIICPYFCPSISTISLYHSNHKLIHPALAPCFPLKGSSYNGRSSFTLHAGVVFNVHGPIRLLRRWTVYSNLTTQTRMITRMYGVDDRLTGFPLYGHLGGRTTQAMGSRLVQLTEMELHDRQADLTKITPMTKNARTNALETNTNMHLTEIDNQFTN